MADFVLDAPSREVAAEWQNAEAAGTWAGLESYERDPLFEALGARPSSHPRALAAIERADVEACIARLAASEPQPPAIVIAKYRLCIHACRVAVGGPVLPAATQAATDGGGASATAEYARRLAEQALLATAAEKGPEVQLRHVVAQATDESAPLLKKRGVDKSYECFRAVFKRDPVPEEECSVEQLSGRRALLDRDVAPYVDFNVWAPHHLTIVRKIKLQGLQLGDDGNLHPIELMGPPSYTAWARYYRLLTAGLLGFVAVGLGPLVDYGEKIKGYIERYGNTIWPLLYQTDVRCRQEHMERLRRRLELAEANATLKGLDPATPFDPAKPWDGVSSAAMSDADFCRKEFEEPALLILTRAGRISDLVGEDVSIARAHTAGSSGDAWYSSHGPVSRKRPAEDSKRGRVHRVVEGAYTHNRGDHPLCRDFQKGACKGGGGMWCSLHRGHVHQCSKCLDPRHGGDACKYSPQEPSRLKGRRKGGKGSGRGGGRGW